LATTTATKIFKNVLDFNKSEQVKKENDARESINKKAGKSIPKPDHKRLTISKINTRPQ
jgi:hypothetical protein